MDSLRDLIEEAKLRTVWWILCIFALTYFLTNTSKSMLTNAPIAVLLVCGLRMLFNELEFRRKDHRDDRPTSYLSHLEKKQVSVDDSRLTTPPQKWKRKIDSPVVEAAAEDFIGKVLKDFVVDLWYSDITPDKEAPQLMHGIIMDVLGEVSGRLKELNLVELLTRDLVDLVGRHLDLFRRNQAAIGVDVMKTLSSEERDERLKHHLLASKELHPALICPESEYKVLKRLMGGVLAVVLRPREVQSPLVRCIARELLTCLVMQPIMNFASPGYINELIEFVILAHNEGFKDVADQSPNVEGHKRDVTVSAESGRSTKSNFEEKTSSNNQGTNSSSFQSEYKRKLESGASGNQLSSTMQYESINQRHADWTKVLEAATQRREEVLMPENLENMWTIGRNYKNKLQKRSAPGPPTSEITDSVRFALPRKSFVIEAPSFKPRSSIGPEDKASMQLPPRQQRDTRITNLRNDAISSSQDSNKELFSKGGSTSYEMENTATVGSLENRNKLKRSNSSSDFKSQSNPDGMFTHSGTAPIINEYYSADINKFNVHNLKSSSDIVVRTEQLHFPPKLRCRVTGAYFEKLGAKSFAVYLIAVTDADNNTWFVKRRYRNFERLHKYLKEIPNYTLHLPPKRIFSSSTEDTFVHQRCLRLDKYLQDLLSVANVAEQHEVWDFLSDSSKNYSFGKSPTVMRTLAVNVDDAMDDIVRQFKETSGGPAPSVMGTPSSYHEPASSTADRNLTWDFEDKSRLIMRQSASESIDSYSDSEEVDKEANHAPEDVSSAAQASGWNLDNELESRRFPPRADNLGEVAGNLNIEEIHSSRMKPESNFRYPDASLALTSVSREDPTGVPPEWTPPNLSVPVLNLVDNIFQLKSRGWLRRQVFWISKQILQLVMEDAIDDWLLRQIQWLRREDVIAQGIHWVKDVLWPNGTFFLRLGIQAQPDNDQADQTSQESTYQSDGRKVAQSGSFEQQLEATRRASIVKKMIFDGAPTPLVSLIGHKQYKRCARDIYYFLQSTVCLKQLGYGMLELVLISIFPELRDLVTDVHHEMHNQTV